MKYFLDRTLEVRRLKSIAGDSYGIRNAYSATGTAYACSQQDIDFGLQQMGFQLGKAYYVFLEGGADVKAGDQVVIRDITYSVREIEIVDFGVQPYVGLIVEKE